MLNDFVSSWLLVSWICLCFLHSQFCPGCMRVGEYDRYTNCINCTGILELNYIENGYMIETVKLHFDGISHAVHTFLYLCTDSNTNNDHILDKYCRVLVMGMVFVLLSRYPNTSRHWHNTDFNCIWITKAISVYGHTHCGIYGVHFIPYWWYISE